MTASALDALGVASRRRILQVLAGGEQPVGAVVEALRGGDPLSQPAVSQHLGVLRSAGLVTVRAEGTRRLYALDVAGLDTVRGWLDQLVDPLASLDQPLDALATEVARGRRARRADPAVATPDAGAGHPDGDPDDERRSA